MQVILTQKCQKNDAWRVFELVKITRTNEYNIENLCRSQLTINITEEGSKNFDFERYKNRGQMPSINAYKCAVGHAYGSSLTVSDHYRNSDLNSRRKLPAYIWMHLRKNTDSCLLTRLDAMSIAVL